MASSTVGLDKLTELDPRVPPPVFWTQNPCFLEVTDRVALHNPHNKGVPCKIFQDKELRAILATSGNFQLKDGAMRTCRDDVLKETSGIIVRRGREIICIG